MTSEKKGGKKVEAEASPEKSEEDVPVTSGMPKPTGREHWGEGGEFKIDSSGRRVRKN